MNETGRFLNQGYQLQENPYLNPPTTTIKQALPFELQKKTEHLVCVANDLLVETRGKIDTLVGPAMPAEQPGDRGAPVILGSLTAVMHGINEALIALNEIHLQLKRL